ncbi:hypothetical protein STENM327S_05457 [Streptomyces tendae]
MTPAATPAVMEYVNGIRTTVRKTGIAVARSAQSTCRAFIIIIAPMTTRAAEATSCGTIAVIGVKKRQAAKNAPVTTEASPVRAPSPTPVADSTKTVWPEPPATPPMAPPAPSMNSAFDRPGMRPLSSASFASVPTPMMVAIASKNPASTSVKTIMPTVIAPTSPQPPNSRSPKSEKSGMETALPCSSGAPLAHCSGSMTPVALRIAATIVPVTMPIRMAPGMLRAWSMKISSRVPAKSRTGQPASSPAGPRVSGVALPCVDEAALDQADDGDEQTDAHGDAVLEGERDRVHDHLAEPGDHEQHDHHAVHHTHAHGLRPGHLRDDLPGDHAGHREPGGQGERHLADEAHQERGDRRGERRRGDQGLLAQGVPGGVLAGEDHGVEQDDVRHRHEGGDAAAHLTRDRGSPVGYVKVPVEPRPSAGDAGTRARVFRGDLGLH